MKVYFSSSLRAKKLYQKNFEKIYQIIRDLGHKHTSSFLIKADPDVFYKRKGGEFAKFYKKLVSKIKKADVCVFEVSLHSLGIGYCVDLALQLGKPTVLLYLKGNKPVFFAGIESDRVQLYEYEMDDLRGVLQDALEVAKSLIDIRFTFFVTSKINNFLTWIAKDKKIPRAVYLRQLLAQEMKKEDFQG